MRRRTRTALAAAAAAVLAVTTAGGPAGPAHASDPGGDLRIFSLEPDSLVPGDVTEETAQLVVRQLYRGLVDYDLAGEPVLAVADTIDQVDNQLWTVTIDPSYSFADGTPVDAEAFARAWDYAAGGPHGQLFDRIASVTTPDSLTLEVELTEPHAGFPALLGHPAFFPVTDWCLDDLVTCSATAPGNGPYVLDGDWDPGVGATLVRNALYPDPGHAIPDTISVAVHPDLASACQAFLADQLDVLYPMLPDCLGPVIDPPGTFTDPSHQLHQLGFPTGLAPFDDDRVRWALSVAIDRVELVDEAFDGAGTPADLLVSPHFDGAQPGLCQACVHDPQAAFALLDEAGGWPGGDLQLWAPAGFGHEAWLTEIGDQIEQALGIPYQLNTQLALPDYLALAEAGGFTGPFWAGWDPAYPVLDAYLDPQFTSGGPANYFGFSNPDVDDLIGAGHAEPITDAILFYQQAEEIILTDLPAAPLWFSDWHAAWSSEVDTFVWSLFNGPEYGLMSRQ